jgi:hypothetical protein
MQGCLVLPHKSEPVLSNGHSRIQTPLDLYTDEDLDDMIGTQEKFLAAVGCEAEIVQ